VRTYYTITAPSLSLCRFNYSRTGRGRAVRISFIYYVYSIYFFYLIFIQDRNTSQRGEEEEEKMMETTAV
jgi:hypothetical protein